MKLVLMDTMDINFGMNVDLVLQRVQSVSEDLLHNAHNVLEEIICNWEQLVVSRIVLLEPMKIHLIINVLYVMQVVKRVEPVLQIV